MAIRLFNVAAVAVVVYLVVVPKRRSATPGRHKIGAWIRRSPAGREMRGGENRPAAAMATSDAWSPEFDKTGNATMTQSNLPTDPGLLRDDAKPIRLLSVAAIAVVSYFVAVPVIHEALGHGLTAALLGARGIGVSSCALEVRDPDSLSLGRWRIVYIAGPIASLLAGIILARLHARSKSGSAEFRFGLWLTAYVCLFQGAGYMMALSFTNFGDINGFVQGSRTPFAWRLGLTILGTVISFTSLFVGARTLDEFLGTSRRKARAARLLITSYLVGSSSLTLAALLGPSPLSITLLSAIPASFGGTVFLVYVILAVGNARPTTRAVPLSPGHNWICYGAAVGVLVLYALVFGPGVPRQPAAGPGPLSLAVPGSGSRSFGAADPHGKRYALLIGVNKYDCSLRDLPCAQNDVEELARTLTRLGYDARNLVMLTDRAGAADPARLPRLANIRREVLALSTECRPRDSVLVALAGHGIQLGPDHEPYFFPSDAKLDQDSSRLSIVELYETLAQCRAGSTLLLVDTCRVDAPSQPPDPGTAHRPTLSDACRNADRIAVLFSSSSGQSTYENEELHHGVFFHFVIKGLGGAAADGDGRVTLRSLRNYLNRQVADYVRQHFVGVEQVPELDGRLLETQCLVDRTTP
jgi:hypothetical protein